MQGFAVGCYLGDEIGTFARCGREEKSAIHFVTVKLEDETSPAAVASTK